MRRDKKVGDTPHTFELVVAHTPVGTDYIINGMYVEDGENDMSLNNGKTITETILANAVRSKK